MSKELIKDIAGSFLLFVLFIIMIFYLVAFGG